MNSTEMISVAEALALVLRHTPAAPPVSVSLSEALGRVLAVDVVSQIDVPPYTKSMMDGFALQANDISGVGTRLTVIEEITAGDSPQLTIRRGTSARIMTGAPLPLGADTVVRFEDTRTPDGGDEKETATVSIDLESVIKGDNVLRQGAVLKKGQTVLDAGKSLSGIDLGLIAEVTDEPLLVRPFPEIAVLATGNELTDAGSPLDPARIRNSNGPMLCGLVQQFGGRARDLGIGRDEVDQLRELIASGLDCDALLLSGGVSAGDMDLVPGVLRERGVRQVFHKVRMRPGKPLWFGVYEIADRVVPVFGLPGNPVSAFACFWLFARPALAVLSGRDATRTVIRTMRLDRKFDHRGPRATFFPGRISQHGAQSTVEPLPWKGSADLLTVTQSDCLICFSEGDRQYEAGETVDVILLSH